jgi:AAA domain
MDAEITWLVEDLVAEAAVTLLSGDSGAGKSTFTLALAGAVAHGREFLGRKTIMREVVVVDKENPLATEKERLNRLRIAETPNLRIWGGWNDPQPEGPMSPALIDHARRCPLLVFDSLVAFHPGSEQDSSETRKFMDGFRRLAAAGASVLVIHHSGKSEGSKQYRGSSDIKASVDTALHLASRNPMSIESLVLTPFKQRIGGTSPIQIEFRNGSFEQSGPLDRRIVENIVRVKPGSNSSEIVAEARAQGVSKHRAEALLLQGKRDGWLLHRKSEKNATKYFLRETEVAGNFSFPDPILQVRKTGKQ